MEDTFKDTVDAYLAKPNPSRKTFVVLTVDGINVLRSEEPIPDRLLRDYRWDMLAQLMMKMESVYTLNKGPIEDKRVNFKLEPAPFVYEHSINDDGVLMPEGIPLIQHTPEPKARVGFFAKLLNLLRK